MPCGSRSLDYVYQNARYRIHLMYLGSIDARAEHEVEKSGIHRRQRLFVLGCAWASTHVIHGEASQGIFCSKWTLSK